MRDLNEVVAKLQNAEDILLNRMQGGTFTNLNEYDELFEIRNRLFKIVVQIQDLQDYYGV